MKDYSKMSDFEINQFITGCEFDCHDWPNNANGDFYQCGFDGNSYFEVSVKDYCNNPSVAWPIIFENEISLVVVEEGVWVARFGSVFDESSNPLRSAMIVYLMMKDADK